MTLRLKASDLDELVGASITHVHFDGLHSDSPACAFRQVTRLANRDKHEHIAALRCVDPDHDVLVAPRERPTNRQPLAAWWLGLNEGPRKGRSCTVANSAHSTGRQRDVPSR